MYGVANTIDPTLRIFDLTHHISQFNIWEASYRLVQTLPYWPEHTVFVSVVDPGVGTDRRSVVAKTKTNHYVVTPDNGTLTHLNQQYGIAEVREIDETINRFPKSENSYTFHGRDIYAYTGAKLASGVITFAQVGPSAEEDIVLLPMFESRIEGNSVKGNIDILDVRFGNVWTNINRSLLHDLNIQTGDMVKVKVYGELGTILNKRLIYARTFGEVPVGEPVMYVNSIDKIGIAINQGSFADLYNISMGNKWFIKITAYDR
ncbi:S-adenosyl-l-methionine hydroxide adenosyltransferase family protein [Salirhabdus salicampi]|nr:S-adenosyl-l-methionine hydroxide adenosyltransferase family protein [Salirhabdus salicampi]